MKMRTLFVGFHYCSFGVNPNYQAALEAAGLRLCAFADDAGVEAIELNAHPFLYGNFVSTPNRTAARTRTAPID